MAGTVQDYSTQVESVRRFMSLVFERGLTDLCEEFLHKDAVIFDPNVPGGEVAGLSAIAEVIVGVLSHFDNYTIRHDALFGMNPEIVVHRFTGFAVHKGGFLGSRLVGKDLTWTGCTIYKFRGGLIEKAWLQWDLLGAMVQLGLVPSLVPTSPPPWVVPAQPGTPFSAADRRSNSAPSAASPDDQVSANVASMRYFFANLIKVPVDELAERCFARTWRHDDCCMPPGCEFNYDGARQYLHLLQECFEGFTAEIDDLYAAGDRVVIRLHCHGRHKGGFMNVPAGNQRIDYTGNLIIRCENSRMAHTWWFWDARLLFTQLGLLPPTRML